MSAARYIVIVGCGRLGSHLANRLSTEGHNVVVIDERRHAFDHLSMEFSGYSIVGDATELEVLKEARIQDADYLFATTTEDNTNLMVAQVARKIFNVPNVVARVYDPAREAIYTEFGIQTISPTNLSSNMFLQCVKVG